MKGPDGTHTLPQTSTQTADMFKQGSRTLHSLATNNTTEVALEQQKNFQVPAIPKTQVRRTDAITSVSYILNKLRILGCEPANAVYTVLCPMTERLARCPTPHRGEDNFHL